jgi:hypothetical protein
MSDDSADKKEGPGPWVLVVVLGIVGFCLGITMFLFIVLQ